MIRISAWGRGVYSQRKDICLKMKITPLLVLDIVPSSLANINILHFTGINICTAEQVNSAIKIIKNYMRKTRTDESVTALELLYIHPEAKINVEQVVNCLLDRPVVHKYTNRSAS